MTIQELEKLLQEYERENLEFKNKRSFSDNELFDYCAALANEGGGYLIFGKNRARKANHFFIRGNLSIRIITREKNFERYKV